MNRFVAGLLVLALAVPVSAQVQVKVADKSVDFYLGKDLVTRYHTKDFAKPIFYPLYAPGQVPLTRDWPIDREKPGQSFDHPHQKSAYFCHGDVIPEGMELKSKIKGVKGVDFWSEAPGHGKIVCTKVGEPQVDKARGSILTHNEWRTAEGEKILDETRKISLFDLGGSRLIVLDINLQATVCPITFGDTKEGSMGIRINDQITTIKVGKGKIENAEGKVGEKDVWGHLSKWCDYSGPIDGKEVGLSILSDDKNLPVAWHARGYGLMAANPFGREHSKFPGFQGKTDLVRIEKGGTLSLRFGLLLHTGDAKSGGVAEAYQKFLTLR